jgi:hypothetical protein
MKRKIISIGNSGNTKNITIKNSEKKLNNFENEEKFQNILLNTNNDIINFCKYCEEIEMEIKYKIFGNISFSIVLKEFKKNLKNLIFFYSGHGFIKNNSLFLFFHFNNNYFYLNLFKLIHFNLFNLNLLILGIFFLFKKKKKVKKKNLKKKKGNLIL